MAGKNFKTFKEAFNALPDATKKHCTRVAEYTKVLYLEAIAVELRMGDAEAKKQLKPEYERAAYLCGLYHDIGKVFIPEQYHGEDEDYSVEEIALYRKHATDGAAMIDTVDLGEEFSDVEKQMLREALAFHHMRPDEKGYPQVATEDEIPLMPLLVGFANHVDFLSTKRRSETPFEDTTRDILSGFPEETELQLLAQETLPKLRRVFMKYQDQSMKIPSVPMFAKRRPNRSFELKYRPILDRKKKETVALQAKMYFKDNKDTYIEYEEVKTILNKNKLIADVGRYFIYEASDTLKRIEVCELPIEYMVLDLMPTYYTQAKTVQVMQQQLADARMEMGKLLFGMDESWFANASKAFLANVERMGAAGFPIFIHGWKGEVLTPEEIKKYSIDKIALHVEAYEKLDTKEFQAMLYDIEDQGVEILAGDIEKAKYNTLLNSLGVTKMTGPMTGDYITEDEMVLSELNLKLSSVQGE